VDSSKVKANAALEANCTERDVKKMLNEAEAKDAKADRRYVPDKRGDELPAEFAN